jgi:hypothetical protein
VFVVGVGEGFDVELLVVFLALAVGEADGGVFLDDH